ncbi:S-adenosyl-L-methionine-dependent methyltransferase [Haematococcus lacustris]
MAEAMLPHLSSIETTAVQVSFYRLLGALAAAGLPIDDLAGLPDSPLGFDYRAHGLPYNPLFDKLFVTHCQLGSSSGMQGWNNERGPSMMAVRTVAIDDQLLEAMASPTPAAGSGSRSSPIPAAPSLPLASSSNSRGLHQVVILGAGLDARAWRLSWPSGTVVFEVDSGALEPLKQRVLGALPLACHARHALVADLARPHQLRSALAQAGFQADQPAVWLMEGLIGYLTRRQARRLLRCTYELSAPGSQLIMNCPPSAEDRAAAAAKGVQLHHKTFEDKHATLTRVRHVGWTAELWDEESIAARYRLPCPRAHIRGCKSEPGRHGAWPLRLGSLSCAVM